MKLCICQIKTTSDKNFNLEQDKNMINNLVSQNADLILLPECFNSPYGIKYFEKNSELLEEGNKTFDFLQKLVIKIQKFIFSLDQFQKDVRIRFIIQWLSFIKGK